MNRKTDSPDDRIRDWLARPDHQEQLTAIARHLSDELHARRLALPFGRDGDGPPDADDVRSELVLFLLERGARLTPLARFGSPGWERYLRTAFVRHCIDRARRPDGDGFRYGYKRTARALRGAPGFHLRVLGRNALAFSRRIPAEAVPPFSAEDFRDISFPAETFREGTENPGSGAAALRRLADHFWQEAARLWDGRPIWVDMRDFVDWMRRFQPADVPRLPVFPDGALPGGFDPVRVRVWGERAADILTRREADALRMRYGDGRRLREIADALGYRGPSGAAYALRQAEARLRGFLGDLPGLSPGDLHPEAFALFHDTLLDALSRRGKGEDR